MQELVVRLDELIKCCPTLNCWCSGTKRMYKYFVNPYLGKQFYFSGYVYQGGFLCFHYQKYLKNKAKSVSTKEKNTFH